MSVPRILFPLMACSAAGSLCAQPTPSADAALADYFRNEVAALSDNCLTEISTLEDWTSRRAGYRRQLHEMLGLWPMPDRTDLKPVVTGRLTNEHFVVEKIQFQASPQLYCTANLYLPTNVTQHAPTILYRCGHWKMITNGASLGNKAVYQVDGAWYARNGYVCLVLDTLLAGEIQGIHTGTRDHGLWWWNSRGYTPAGVEAWFGIRALDYLCTRAEVDTNRIGVTGHSGGGAYSWTLAALDDRIKTPAPLAGMADLQSHILDGVMDSHCDCNFFVNTYRWDFPQLAALIAPRPLLIGGTDNDRLFNLETTLRIHEKVRRIYKLYGATDKLGLTIAPGPHDEAPELRLATLRWFDRFLKGEETGNKNAVVMESRRAFPPMELRVFDGLPADSINTNIAETFVPLAGVQQRSPDALRSVLREKVFAGWPAADSPMEPKLAFSIRKDDMLFRAWDFTSQQHVRLRVYLLESLSTNAETVSLTVLDDRGWTSWLPIFRARAGTRAEFTDRLTGEFAAADAAATDAGNVEKILQQIKAGAALAYFAPRGVGLDAWSGDAKAQTKIHRRFMLLGQTVDGMRVWDIRRAIQTIHNVRADDRGKVNLHTGGSMAVNALYAALFEPNVRRLELQDHPESQQEGPDYLGILKFSDIPRVRDAVSARAGVNAIAE